MKTSPGLFHDACHHEKNTIKNTYVSLFSGAGIGCQGLSMANFQCLATVEINHRRLEIQRLNNKCMDENAYICGDLEDPHTMDAIRKIVQSNGGVDVVIATPPCQGMSIFNHKKKDEIKQNSLVIAAIEAVRLLHPKVFIFENVAGFFKTPCNMSEKGSIPIGDAIDERLGKRYDIRKEVINLKDFGCPSSRTRALVIGVEKKQSFSSRFLRPDRKWGKTLKEVIGDLPPLPRMGQIDPNDIYHSFKPYDKRMLPWISGLAEGKSAFDRQSPARRPHRIINGKRVDNKNGNGDKYRRQRWDSTPPCVHTRNDILSSQNTIHPRDNRVFSIREIMRFLSIPDDFRWHNHSVKDMSNWSIERKQIFLRSSENNIRQCLGEAVPPMVIFNIGEKIIKYLNRSNDIATEESILDELMQEIERTNSRKKEHAAYYTPSKTAYKTLQMLPDFHGKKHIRILEPSVGAGQILRLLPAILSNYENVTIDVMDIDNEILKMAKELFDSTAIKFLARPNVLKINFIHGDFLDYPFGNTRYDLIVGNPPFRRMPAAEIRKYSNSMESIPLSKNTFSHFLIKAIDLANHVVFIGPKSFLNAPEYNAVREYVNKNHAIRGICDFGEKGFKGVKIETIALAIETNCLQQKYKKIKIESVPRDIEMTPCSADIFSNKLPYWVIYRDEHFDSVLETMETNIFSAFRDRQITKKNTNPLGGLRVIKSRNVQPEGIQKTPQDVYVDKNLSFAGRRYMNRKDVFLVPNLSYSPRACFMPRNSVTDGSVAILHSNDSKFVPTTKDLEYFASESFHDFYRVARNYGTRTLNIDSNSVFFFGVNN